MRDPGSCPLEEHLHADQKGDDVRIALIPKYLQRSMAVHLKDMNTSAFRFSLLFRPQQYPWILLISSRYIWILQALYMYIRILYPSSSHLPTLSSSQANPSLDAQYGIQTPSVCRSFNQHRRYYWLLKRQRKH